MSLYNDFFGFREAPFSIAPDPRYLYLSERHKEALAHLMYGIQGQGGFIVITGEVGTGKTTVCRCFLESVPDFVDIALVLNPKLSARELLATICDELRLRYPAGASIKRLIDQINAHLLESHGRGGHTVLVIDEAQNLSADVLEQLRLLTNLETGEKKLLQIVLLGQPELQDILETRELRQLAQRITARYHLDALDRDELQAYLRYRLSVAGSRQPLFLPAAVKALYRLSGGIPRLVNLIADRALLGAYSQGLGVIDARTVRRAGREVLGNRHGGRGMTAERRSRQLVLTSIAAGMVAVAILVLGFRTFEMEWAGLEPTTNDSPGGPLAEQALAAAPLDRTAVESLPIPEAPATSDGDAESATPAPLAVAPSPEPDPEGTALLANWTPTATTTLEAYQALFNLWSVGFDRDDSRYACEFAEQHGLRCLHRQGNWRSLEQLDRPAILRIFNHQGDAYHIALLKLDGGRARIALGGQIYSVDRTALNEHWLGDYSILWRVPPYDEAIRKADDSLTKERWLTHAMASLRQQLGVPADDAAVLARSPLEAQVKWFQRHAGLVPDGIPGTVTLIRINTVLDSTVPRLQPAQEPDRLAHQN